MSFNLATYSRLFVSSGAYKVLTEAELALFQDGDIDGTGVSVSSETLSVTYDLGARYRLKELRYYHDAATVENVAFFGKQGTGSEFEWEEITSSDAGAYLTADLESIGDRYEFVRAVHTVTTGSAVVYEFSLLTDGNHIEFGETGTATIYSVDSGTNTLFPEEVLVYNPDSAAHDFFVLPVAEDSDSVSLALSLTSSGTFDALYESGLSVPDNFTWSSGSFVNTEEGAGGTVLSSGTSGFYYTPVIDVSSLEGRRFFWSTTLSGTNKVDEVASVDSVFTAGVRFSNEAPTDGGWVSGQMSTDSNWQVDTGNLTFEPYFNNQILNPAYLNYFQARLEFTSPSAGQTPILLKVGIESGVKLTIGSLGPAAVYVKSLHSEHVFGRQAEIVVWNFESRNEEQ